MTTATAPIVQTFSHDIRCLDTRQKTPARLVDYKFIGPTFVNYSSPGTVKNYSAQWEAKCSGKTVRFSVFSETSEFSHEDVLSAFWELAGSPNENEIRFMEVAGYGQ